MTHEGYCYEGSAWEHIGRARGSPGFGWRSLHHAQAPAVLDHSRALPQADGGTGPAFAGGAEGGELLHGEAAYHSPKCTPSRGILVVVTGNFLHEHHDPAPQGGIINSHERSDQP